MCDMKPVLSQLLDVKASKQQVVSAVKNCASGAIGINYTVNEDHKIIKPSRGAPFSPSPTPALAGTPLINVRCKR